MINIYLIRHIQTEFNRSGVMMGRVIDAEVDRTQISTFRNRVQKIISNDQPVRIFSSPLRRCVQTASLVKEELDSSEPLIIEDGFTETDYGEFSGKSFERIRSEYPDMFNVWMSSISQIRFPNGETLAEVQDRSWSKLELLARNSDGPIVIVTHVDVIKMIISKVLNIPIDLKKHFHIDNGSISLVEFTKDRFKVKYLNNLTT